MRLFRRFPILFFILGGFLLVNNLFHLFPESVMTGTVAYVVPGILILLGAVSLWMKSKSKN